VRPTNKSKIWPKRPPKLTRFKPVCPSEVQVGLGIVSSRILGIWEDGSKEIFWEDWTVPIPSMERASLGHSATHKPQSVQVSVSISATWSTLMAFTGHTSIHIPHPLHLFSSILTAISITPLSTLNFHNSILAAMKALNVFLKNDWKSSAIPAIGGGSFNDRGKVNSSVVVFL
jgi:hypothetical protein